MIVRKTTKEESRQVNALFAIAFEQPMENGPADPKNENIHHWAAFEETTGEMTSTLSVSDYQIHFDGHVCKMGGIGGVASLPQYRRQGGIRSCFQRMLPDLYKQGYDFSYLYPFSTAYYRKFGYESCVQKLQVSIVLEQLTPDAAAGSFRLAQKHNPMAAAIKAIDRVWEHTYNMMVQHQDSDYGWTEEFDPAGKQEFTYVYFDEADRPKAYTTFRKEDQPDGRNLVCSRFCFTDKEGFSGLMQLFKRLATDHTYVKLSLPATSSMEYLLPEWSMRAVQRQMENAGMVRIINAKSALLKAAYLGSGRVTLQILDRQIPENNNCYTVTFASGRAVSVEESQEAPDAVMEISAFSALLSGVTDFRDAAQWFTGLEIRNPESLWQVFYRKPLMISDYF